MKRKLQKYEDTGWIEPQLLNGWANYSSEYQKTSYRVINGILYIKGLVRDGNNGVIFMLPEIYKPSRTYMMLGNNSLASFVRIDITRGGYVSISGSFHQDWVSLDGITIALD